VGWGIADRNGDVVLVGVQRWLRLARYFYFSLRSLSTALYWAEAAVRTLASRIFSYGRARWPGKRRVAFKAARIVGPVRSHAALAGAPGFCQREWRTEIAPPENPEY